MTVIKTHIFFLLFCYCTKIAEGKEGKCDAGWENYGHKCYKVIYPPGPGKATEFIHLCNQRYGEEAHAVQVSSQAENDWVVEFAKKTLKTDGKYDPPIYAWILIGGRKPPGGELRWDKDGVMDGNLCPMNYTNWGPEEPTGNGESVDIYLDDSIPPLQTSYPKWKTVFYGKWDDYTRNNSISPIMCEKNTKDSKFDTKTCSYVEDCLNIKRSTLMTILESCACSA